MTGYGRKLGTKAVASLAAAWLVLVTLPAWAQTLPIPLVTGPQDPSQLNQTINTLIAQINGVLVPAFGSTVIGSSGVSLGPGQPGGPGVIGLQPGAGANTGIQITPNGSGNIILFSGTTTGVLQFANSSAFVPAGLANAPGIVPGKQPLGMHDHLSGYLIVQDWLGRSYGVAAY
jgi:hypothetical protein